MRTWDEEIGRRLQEAADSGELQSAKGYGKPTPEDPAWYDTPEVLRMSMKILKDAGAAPPEIAMFRERAQLKQQLAAATDPDDRHRLQLRLVEIEAVVALRLEALRTNADI
jgi:hypothetical protein